MAEKNNIIKTTVVLDATQAQQQIVKLNAIATDSTKSLEERTKAKNQQVKIQNELSKQTITDLEKTVRGLKGVAGEEKKLEAAEKKLNSARLKATKLQVSGEKTQRKLNQAYKDGKNPINNLDRATGGLISKMKLFLANPIGIVLVALVGIFALVKKAMNATEDGAASFNAVMAALGQLFTSLITIVSDLLMPIMETLVNLFTKDLGPAFEAMSGYVDAIKKGFSAFANGVKLALTPLRSLIALAQAAALAVKGDFEGAKQVMTDFKQSVIDTAVAIKDDLVEAIQLVVDTTNEVGEAYKNATKDGDSLIALAAQIEVRQNAFNKAKRAQLLLDAKLAVLSRTAKADAKDKAKTDEERKAALISFSKIEEERLVHSLARLKEEIQLKRDRLSLGKNTAADEDELNNLLIQREFLMEKNQKRQGIVNAMMGEFVLLAEANAKKEIAAQIKLEALEIERLRAKNELTLEMETKFLEKKRDLELQNVDLTETQKEVIRQKFVDAAQALKDAKTEKEAEEAVIRLETELLDLEDELERKRRHGDNVLALELEILERRRLQELDNKELTEAEKEAIDAKYVRLGLKVKESVNKAKGDSDKAAAEASIGAAAEVFGIGKEVAIAESVMGLGKSIGDAWAANASKGFPGNVIATAAQIGAQVPPIVKSLADIKKTTFSGGKGKVAGGGQSVSVPTGIGSSAISDIGANNAARLGIDPTIGANATNIASSNVQGSSQQGIVFSEERYTNFQDQVSFKEEKTTIG